MAEWTNRNGVFIPDSLAKKMDSARNAPPQGKFFSNYTIATSISSLGHSKPADEIQFEMLTLARERSLIDKLIINARIWQMQRHANLVIAPGKQLGWRVQHKLAADPKFKATKEIERRCKEVQEIIESVNPKIHPNGFIDFASQWTDFNLTFDRNAMVITRDRQDLPVMYHIVDSTTIRPVLQVIFNYQERHLVDGKPMHEDRVFQDMYHNYGIDLTDAAYVQVIDGVPVASWTEKEMAVNITNTSVKVDKWAYGAGSNMEQSLAATQTWLNAWAYNDGLFRQDSPESLLFLYGDIDPIGLGAFQRQVLDQSGSGDYQKVPVIQADPNYKAELVEIRKLPKDVQFAEFLRMVIQLKTAAFRAHPSIVNFSIDRGSGGQLSIGSANEDELIKQSKEEGFVSLCGMMASWITRTIIEPRYDDLVMVFDTDLDDNQKRLEQIKLQTEIGMTFNEARRAMDLDGDLEGGDIPNNPVYAQAMQAAKMQEQMAAQQGQAGPQEGGKPPAQPGAKKPPDKTEKPENAVKKHLAKSEKVLVFEISN